MRLRGEPFRAANPREAERAGIAAVFQELSLVPDLTVAENIFFRRETLTSLRTIARGELLRRTTKLLADLDLSPIPPTVRCGTCRWRTGNWSRSPRR